jgi:alkylhydroperoxidase/carboxymuconolactone decarboxylase family protein YurZ
MEQVSDDLTLRDRSLATIAALAAMNVVTRLLAE